MIYFSKVLYNIFRYDLNIKHEIKYLLEDTGGRIFLYILKNKIRK